MLFIGLDLSMTTGMVAIDDNDPFSGVNSWIIKPNKNIIDLIIKKMDIAGQIAQNLKSFNKDCVIAIEGYSFSKFGMAESGELGGIVKAKLKELGIDYMIFPPTSIKKFACGKGSAKKELMIAAVFKKWAFDTNSNDLADAFSIAKLAQAVYIYKNCTDLVNLGVIRFTDYQLEVIKNLVESKIKKIKKEKTVG